ncbi:site-specific DNA-methyltransferase [Salibacteraceae bacterium]|nr:site-specific DNA-methyltransferase [Salibacteraceae bacterium]
MSKKVDSIKHKEKRAHIPSKEEAGYEDANNTVNKGKTTLELPKNPVVHRGQDPELFWKNKYGNDDREDILKVDIRSLYRHEHIAPEQLIQGLYKTVVDKKDGAQTDMFSSNEMFGNALDRDELEKVSEYYQHSDGWTNRLIQGDSHLVMTSLLEREGMAGQVQTIFIDPPYGIKYNSNWQMKLNDRNVKDGSDIHITGEPEMVKAFRDTWELGIHSYLTYLRNRLLIAKELLSESGSCIIQISDDNVHLVRNIMDEVFGSENFVNQISFRKSLPLGAGNLPVVADYMIWYSKSKENMKYRQLYVPKSISSYTNVELKDGTQRRLKPEERNGEVPIPEGAKIFSSSDLKSSGYTASCTYDFEFNGRTVAAQSKSWRTTKEGVERLIGLNRLLEAGKIPRYKQYYDDFPLQQMDNLWNDTQSNPNSQFVVQTSTTVLERIILMTTDPGDLVLDPTCGSGTTAFVAEQWGRRWITIDTSRIALNIAKQRLLTSQFDYYKLYSEEGDIRLGFQYQTVPHITLKSLANNEPFSVETIYDNPIIDKAKLRVAGPFTVETLQNYEPVSPETIDNGVEQEKDNGNFEERIFEHLKSAGVKNGIKNEQAVFIRVERLADSFLHAEGFYLDSNGVEKKAYFHIGPKFGTVAKKAVNEAVKSCRQRGDADWLIILGFSFESDINNQNVTMSVGSFEVTKARMHDDLMQDGLLKKDKKAASFVTIGEPDIQLHKNGSEAHVEVCGLDIYDPIKDVVKARNIEDIAYWMVDDDYDGSNFVVKQVFFCGGKKDEFKKWRKGLDDLAKRSTKKKVEMTLKIEIDDDAFDRLYGFESHPFEAKKGQKVAVRVISQFGEESTKVLTV